MGRVSVFIDHTQQYDLFLYKGGFYEKKEVNILLAALTKGGKTTIVIALARKKLQRHMRQICNGRTETTVDWVFTPEAEDIRLTQIVMNYKGIFGTSEREREKCEKYNETIASEDGKYLRDIFGMTEQDQISVEELEQYIESKASDYVAGCTDNDIRELLKNRKTSRFIRRIRVEVPPSESLLKMLTHKNIELIIRDTRGWLDLDPEEAENVKNWSKYDLGLDGINAAILLGTNAFFPDSAGWYKKAFGDAFEAVPVFLMARRDSVRMLYEASNDVDLDEADPSDLSEEKIKAFIQKMKSRTAPGYKRLENAFIPLYRLLEMIGIGKMQNNIFTYNRKVYENVEMQYLCPESETLLSEEQEEPDYNSPEYLFYEMIIHENVKDIVEKTLEHEQFKKAAFEDGQIQSDIIRILSNKLRSTCGDDKFSVPMHPCYRKYNRHQVCDSILGQNSILGPRNGITTKGRNGDILYLGAVTSAVSARQWLKSNVHTYEFTGVLKNPNGSDVIKNMSKECQTNLIRMFLLDKIESHTDCYASFYLFYFIDRYDVKKAIETVRNNGITDDAIDAVTEEIAKQIFE